jgi:hypothetical protein
MLELPKKISAIGYDCAVACAIMVFAYWRIQKPNLKWNISTDFDNEEWNACFRKGLNYIRNSGLPITNIKRMLSAYTFPLHSSLELLDDICDLEKNITFRIPPIVFYDYYYLARGIKRTPWHAVVAVDVSKEMLTVVDPSREPKYISRLAKKDFTEAWAITENATVIIRPKAYKIRHRRIPTKPETATLKKWMGNSEIHN